MSSSRSRQGTEAQLGALVDFFEQDPEIARGHIKTARAKTNIRLFWERVTPSLNRLGGGTKTQKQWMKYWTDKKLAIKKKAAERAAARRRTGGGVENIKELTETEERVLHLLGGEGYAVGDRHLQYGIIQHSSEVTTAGTATSPSILPHIVNSHQDTPYTSAYYGFEPVSPHSPLPMLSHEEENRRNTTTQSPHQSGLELDGAPSPIRQSRPRNVSPIRQSSPRNFSANGPRRQPPSQRRSQMTLLSQNFLRIEERRLVLEEKQAEINFMAAQAQRDMAAAIRCLGEGNKAVAATIRDGVSVVQAIVDKYFS